MTTPCTCKAEHWQPHADSCPAKQNKGTAVTNPKVCKFCKMPIADGEERQSAMGGYGHSREAWCIRAMQTELTQLRGNLSLAEEGLANYALEVERLKAALRLLDNGFKHSTEVCNIARGALAQSSHELEKQS